MKTEFVLDRLSIPIDLDITKEFSKYYPQDKGCATYKLKIEDDFIRYGNIGITYEETFNFPYVHFIFFKINKNISKTKIIKIIKVRYEPSLKDHLFLLDGSNKSLREVIVELELYKL